MEQADKAFHEVSDKTLKVSSLVSEIATASSEQTSGIGQVNKAVTEMDQVVQKNAAYSEESASAAEELKILAEVTREYVNELRMLVGGKGATAHTVVKGYERFRFISTFPTKETSIIYCQSTNNNTQEASR